MGIDGREGRSGARDDERSVLVEQLGLQRRVALRRFDVTVESGIGLSSHCLVSTKDQGLAVLVDVATIGEGQFRRIAFVYTPNSGM